MGGAGKKISRSCPGWGLRQTVVSEIQFPHLNRCDCCSRPKSIDLSPKSLYTCSGQAHLQLAFLFPRRMLVAKKAVQWANREAWLEETGVVGGSTQRKPPVHICNPVWYWEGLSRTEWGESERFTRFLAHHFQGALSIGLQPTRQEKSHRVMCRSRRMICWYGRFWAEPQCLSQS